MRSIRRRRAVPDTSVVPTSGGEAVTVEVVGAPATASQLTRACPVGWRVVTSEMPSHHPLVDLVVLVAPAPGVVREVVAGWPGTDCVVLLDGAATPAEVVDAIDAGAAACVRDAPVELLVRQLVAARRHGRG